MISSNHYHNELHLTTELDKIFYDNWLFVATKTELANNNDFVTLDIGKHAIVVQNFRGNVKAYKNICLHRFSKIQTQRKGNRPFFCAYHGWAYTPDGAAIVPPKFQDEAIPKDCLKLDTYEVASCGAFYFIKLNAENSQTLQDFLGEYYSILENFSNNFGKEIYNEVMPHDANWKLLIENVLECYHCKTVHSETFIPMGIGMALPTNIRSFSKHNDCEYPKVQSAKLEAKANKLAFLNYKKYKHESYHHLYIYPNLFISSTEGNLLYVGSFTPTSPTHTDLIVRFYSPVLEIPEDVKVSNFFVEAYFEASIGSALTVLQEDKVVLENIQSVVHKIDRNPIFGKEEFRIDSFYNNYFSDINHQ